MPIKKIALDGNRITSLNDLYDQLSAGLSLPGHFGRNLDALWDALSTDIEGPFEITWKHSAASKRKMGKDYKKVLKLLTDLKKEREDFSLKIE